jgi:hypothetical protein
MKVFCRPSAAPSLRAGSLSKYSFANKAGGHNGVHPTANEQQISLVNLLPAHARQSLEQDYAMDTVRHTHMYGNMRTCLCLAHH